MLNINQKENSKKHCHYGGFKKTSSFAIFLKIKKIKKEIGFGLFVSMGVS